MVMLQLVQPFSALTQARFIAGGARCVEHGALRRAAHQPEGGEIGTHIPIYRPFLASQRNEMPRPGAAQYSMLGVQSYEHIKLR
jgi:hypothetical protein